jgi:hypothetical protein
MSILTCNNTKYMASLSAAIVMLFSACGARTGAELPSQVSRFPADLSNPGLALSGIYADGWVGAKGSLDLRQPGGERALSIRGEVPQIADAGFHTSMVVSLDGQEVARRDLPVGAFQLSVPAKTAAGKHSITVEFSPLQQLPGGDGRNVAARLQSIGFGPVASPNASESSDIVRGAGLELGTGWGAIETFKNETFRWVDNDAQVLITAAKSGDMAISLLAEPGPGVGGRFLLKALNASGKQVASVPVEKRGAVKLVVPVEAGGGQIRLHVDGGGKRTANDPRILNFRVFQIQAAPWS